MINSHKHTQKQYIINNTTQQQHGHCVRITINYKTKRVVSVNARQYWRPFMSEQFNTLQYNEIT